MEKITIEKGFETAFHCYLNFDANEAHDYFLKHQDIVAKAVAQIEDKGASYLLPPVLMVSSESVRGLGEKLSFLYELGYRPYGNILLRKEGYISEYVQEVMRLELPHLY